VHADASASLQILDNLVSNAVKYSPPGKRVVVRITNDELRISNVHSSLHTSGVCIAVQDEGPGLSDEDKTKLFGKFARLSARPTAGEHSTGLGLSIVKRLAEAMNGNIHCKSTLGEGATFILVLPQSSQS
jgi:signal transduction histidine kinase